MGEYIMIFNMVGGGGGSSDLSSIIAEVESGSVVTCTKGPIILTGTSNGTVRFDELENGTWNLKATKNGLSADTTVNITKFQIYYVTMSYFTATIKVTFPTDATSVICVNGSTTLSVPSESLASGEYTFTVHDKGTWTLTAKNASNTDTTTVNVQAEQQYTAALAFALYLIKDGRVVSGVNFTEKYGVQFVAQSNDGLYMEYNDPGGVYAAIITQKYDLSKYKTVNIDCRSLSNNAIGYIGIIDENTSLSAAEWMATAIAKTTSSGIPSTWGTKRTLDISSVTGSHSVGIWSDCAKPNMVDLLIRNFWLST